MINNELQKKIDRSIRLLQSIKPIDNQPIEIAYSGGKDSDVILQLAKEAGIKYEAIYKNTTIDPPGTIKHVKEMGVTIKQPKESFFQLVARKGLPSRIGRFCCQFLKEYKIYDIAVIGVRKDESAKRAKRYDEPIICRFYGSKKVHAQNVMPILDWTLQDVADYIEDRKIKCAPVYYEGDVFHPERRLGCMGCPIASKAHRLKELRDHPAVVKAILRSLQKYYDTHQHTKTVEHYGDIYTQFTRFYFFDTDEQFYKRQSNMFGDVDCKKFLEDYFGITL